jgi:hypothetical protein
VAFRRTALYRAAAMDWARAKAFIEAIPPGRWTSPTAPRASPSRTGGRSAPPAVPSEPHGAHLLGHPGDHLRRPDLPRAHALRFGVGSGQGPLGGGSYVERNLNRWTIGFAIAFTLNTILLIKQPWD